MEQFIREFLITGLITFLVTVAIVFYMQMRQRARSTDSQRDRNFEITIGN